MGRRSKNNNNYKLNRTLLITGIIFALSGILALTIILNKGVIFGKRLIPLTSKEPEEPQHVIQVVADNNYLKNIGDTVELTVTIDGQEAVNGEGYELTSSDETIVSLEGNTAKAESLGDAVITVKSTELEIEGTVTLSVVVPASKLNIEAEFDEIKVGETSQISHTTRPTEATGVQVKLTYTSSDNSIATVDSSGIVTGKSVGVATITATDKITGLSDTYDITVE